MNDLSNIDFGKLAAESEISLEEYFVEHPAYLSLRDGKKNIALGNRGVGKTAVFKMLDKYHSGKGAIVINLTPETYSYEFLSSQMVKEVDGAWAKQSAYNSSWLYLLYVLAMKYLLSNDTSRMKRGSIGKIHDYLRDNHKQIDKNPISALISYVKRIEGLKVGNIEASVKVKQLDSLYKLEEINGLLDDLREVSKRKNVVFLVDELDRGWDNSEDAQAFVAGLIDASFRINQSMTGNIKVLISLRRELYVSIPSLYKDAQKYRDLIEVIEWDEITLKKLICKRIARSLPHVSKGTDEEIWRTVFPEFLEYRQSNSFNYVVDRTLYRPRELIYFCALIQDKYIQAPTPTVNYSIISEAERLYSQDRLNDIVMEYEFQYPSLLSVLETFRGSVYSLDKEELELHLTKIIIGDLRIDAKAYNWIKELETHNLTKILWEVGFITCLAVGGVKGKSRSGSRYVGYHQLSSLPLDNISKFQIHQMFRSFLGLKEKKSSSPSED
ncbi:MAG: hypothetical protein MUF38_11865 [Anaerolineae bacterium]|jgi:hypothetical protein|nr:hypothetical protein [Anaerolineae bacterium]